jgi:hypothetical protein
VTDRVWPVFHSEAWWAGYCDGCCRRLPRPDGYDAIEYANGYAEATADNEMVARGIPATE